MKTVDENFQRRDDVVFENRNKEYGAYLIRAAYSTNVVKSWFVSALFVFAALVLPGLMGRWKGKRNIFVLPGKDTTAVVVYPPPVIESPPPPATAHVRGSPAGQFPVATAQGVSDDSLSIEKIHLPMMPGDEPGDDLFPAATTLTGGAGDGQGTEPATPAVLSAVENMPQFEGGNEAMMKFISRHLKYPPSAIRVGAEGIVFVQFVVDRDGRVKDIVVMKGIFGACDQESMRVIGIMPRWKPGMQNHTPVAVRMALPVRFTLEH
jgi:protein TonB